MELVMELGWLVKPEFIDLEIEPFSSPGLAQLVITRQNRVPIIEEIEVIPNAGPYIIINSYTIDAGGDDIIEFGENS